MHCLKQTLGYVYYSSLTERENTHAAFSLTSTSNVCHLHLCGMLFSRTELCMFVCLVVCDKNAIYRCKDLERFGIELSPMDPRDF